MIIVILNLFFQNLKIIQLFKKNSLIIISSQVPIGSIKKLECFMIKSI